MVVFCLIISLSAHAGENEKAKQLNKKQKTESNSLDDKAVKLVKKALVFPNPTKGKLNVVFATAQGTPPTFTVFNILGNDLRNVEVNQLSSTHFEINLTEYDAGLYFIRIESREFTITERVTLDFTRNYTIS